MKVRHSGRVKVVTSSRRSGRVTVGLSWQLRQWQACVEEGREPTVEDPHAWAAVLVWRRRLRAAWIARADAGGVQSPLASEQEPTVLRDLAERLRRSPGRLLRDWCRADAFGSFWQAVELQLLAAARPRSRPSLPMRNAVAELRSLIGCQRATGASRTGRVDIARVESR
jgi:hypothetical protein